MSIYGGGGGGRTRMGTKVYLNVYDLSPANEYLYHVGLGLYHSGVEIMGSEYSFASGAGIFDNTPKEAPGALFREQIYLGNFEGGQNELNRALDDLRISFGPDDYHLIRKNCNSFANAFCWKLLQKPIPGYVNRLAEIGICCSCLLPKKMLEQAPVGDPNRTNSGGYKMVPPASSRMSSPSSTRIEAFSGTGARLGSNSENGNNNTTSGHWRWPSTAAGKKTDDDLTDRREKARKAALARLEKNQSSQPAQQ